MIPDRKLVRLLVHLTEELAEVQKCCSKLIRKGCTPKNLSDFEEEFGDVLSIVERLSGKEYKGLALYNLFDTNLIEKIRIDKIQRILPMLIEEEQKIT